MVGRVDQHLDGDRSIYRGPRLALAPVARAAASTPKVLWRARRPSGMTLTAWPRSILAIQPRSK
jgi:hypothetical protein